MPTTISLDGSGNFISLRLNAGLVEYSTDQSTFTPIANTAAWPVTINNTNPTANTRLRVVATTNLTITSGYGNTSGYFIANTAFITFDGSGNTMTFDGITNYPGFIQNGTNASTGGKANVIVQNFTTAMLTSATLASSAGWLCQAFFGTAVSGTSITNCTNSSTGLITATSGGGLVGRYAGSYSGGSITFTSCTNNAVISGADAGGIAGKDAGGGSTVSFGSATFSNCSNTGVINGSSGGGVSGASAGSNGTATFTGCSNTGNITIASAGGVCGGGAATGTGSRATFTSCTNTGNITTSDAGGIVGSYCGAFGGTEATFTSCTNSGNVSGSNAGGIAGGTCAANSGVGTFTSCSNTGPISGALAGGISGAAAGAGNVSSFITFTSCSNAGTISGQGAGGIVGGEPANTSGTLTCTGCSNTGSITGIQAGGITGSNAGRSGGISTITNCFNTGDISAAATDSGGICGYRFTSLSSRSNIVSGCYNTGAINGTRNGGIIGGELGLSNTATASVLDISGCYSLGAVATTCGGICGGANNSYTTKATLGIKNSYSSGALTGTGAGMTAVSLAAQVNLTLTNTFVANGSGAWTDASASTSLAGTPTNLTTSNPGSTWTTIVSNTPYVLSAYNAALYSPSSVTASNNYTSAPGLFQSDYTYQIVYSTQASNVFTARVFASKGTAPSYNSYNFNTFTLTNLNGGLGTPISASINASNGVLDIFLPYPCFLEGTKILCFENNEEIYRPIESLKKGDLVKTIYNGYMPINMLGTTTLYNPGNDYRTLNRLYRCPKEKYPTLFEDLYITGCHSILVPVMTDDQWENTKAINKTIYVTDNHFRLIACADEKAEPYNKEGFMNIYHIALDHRDICMNYGIYANGLLVESCSIEYLIKYSNLKIIGQDETAVSQEMHMGGCVFNNITPQLVDYIR